MHQFLSSRLILPRSFLPTLLFSFLLCVVSDVDAESAVPFDFVFSGYGTIGYAWLNDEDAEYRTAVGIDGATNEGSFKMDTRAAIQFDAVFNPVLSSTAQFIARQGPTGDADAQVEWGFLRLLPADRIEIRLGRMALPVFSRSDYREVGYTSVMLRTPEDVYSQVPLRRLNGADITLESLVLNNLVTLQLFGGESREKLFDGLEPDAKSILGLSAWVERGPVKARFNYTTTQMDLDSRTDSINELRQGIDGTLAQFPDLAPILSPVRKDVSGKRTAVNFASFGLSAEFDSFFFDFEMASRRMDNWLVDVNSWSIVGGRTFGRFNPYVFVSSNKDAQSDRRVDLPDNPVLDQLEAGINRLYIPRSQNTVGGGLRYDLSENIALKSQLEYISREERGISFYRFTVDDDSDKGEDVVLVSLALDFVF